MDLSCGVRNLGAVSQVFRDESKQRRKKECGGGKGLASESLRLPQLG
jgi:hypothetical protein